MTNRLRDDFLTVVAVGALALCATVGATGCGPAGGVRSITVCATYDHTLGRVDPNTGAARDATGASVCAEAGPREQ